MRNNIFAGLVLLLLQTTAQAREFLFVAHEFAPISWSKEGAPAGGIIDVFKEACHRLGHKCKFELTPLARAFKLAEDGHVDGILSLYKTPEREKDFYDSPYILRSNLVYMARSQDKIPKMKSIKDLAGYQVISIRGTVLLKIIKGHAEQAGNVKIIEEVDNPHAMRLLAKEPTGSKTLLASTEDVIKFAAAKNKITMETVYLVEDKPFIGSFSKKRVSEAEAKLFNETIEKMKKDGTVKKILATYNLRSAEG